LEVSLREIKIQNRGRCHLWKFFQDSDAEKPHRRRRKKKDASGKKPIGRKNCVTGKLASECSRKTVSFPGKGEKGVAGRKKPKYLMKRD